MDRQASQRAKDESSGNNVPGVSLTPPTKARRIAQPTAPATRGSIPHAQEPNP